MDNSFKNTTFLILTSLALTLSYMPARATHDRPMCNTRSTIIQDIAEQHGESLKTSGASYDGSLLEVFANDETGTFTIILTRNGITGCIALDGDAYREIDVPSGVPA